MKNKFIKLIVAIIAIIGLTGISTPAFADCTDPCNCPNIPEDVRIASGCVSGNTDDKFEIVVINIINGIIGILSIVAVAVIIIAGVQIMTSAGDAGKVKKGKDAILYASIGLAVAALAAVIVNFVIVNLLQ
jgi:hypothetical protein